jgi:hypothetical protein
VLCCLAAAPAQSCIVSLGTSLEDVKFADLVVVGRVANYQIILDAKAREDRKALLANLPEDTSPEMREGLASQASFIGDYARFEIIVDEVLRGHASRTISAIWDNSTFGENLSWPSEPFLIALVAPGSSQPPLRGPSATISARPDDESMAVLQAPCSGAFMIPASSVEAHDIRAILAHE